MASCTRSRVAARTLGCSLMTRETVWWDTPASRATSKIVAARARSSSAPVRASSPTFGSVLDWAVMAVDPLPRHAGCRPPCWLPVCPLEPCSPSPRGQELLQHDEHEEQAADEDARPPRAEGALEGDDRLDHAEDEGTEHRSGDEPVSAGQQSAADDHRGDRVELGADGGQRVAGQRV